MKKTQTATLAYALAGSAAAQDMIVCLQPISPTRGQITAEYQGLLPAGTTSIGTMWSDTGFTLSTTSTSTFTITDWNAGYNTPLFGGPTITGNGTSTVSFAGIMPAAPIGTPDASNPLLVAEFDFEPGLSIFNLSMQLTGQNSALFVGNPSEPFGTILLYQDAAGNPGPLTFRIDNKFPPSPGTATGLAIGAALACRRRREIAR